MTTLKLFYQAAEEAFKRAGLVGDFHGIKVKDDGVYFVHDLPLRETLWTKAYDAWESIYRSLRAINDR